MINNTIDGGHLVDPLAPQIMNEAATSGLNIHECAEAAALRQIPDVELSEELQAAKADLLAADMRALEAGRKAREAIRAAHARAEAERLISEERRNIAVIQDRLLWANNFLAGFSAEYFWAPELERNSSYAAVEQLILRRALAQQIVEVQPGLIEARKARLAKLETEISELGRTPTEA
jgi:hypothetical protein